MITITVYKTVEDQNNKINGEKIIGKDVDSIYSEINKKFANNINDFYAWNTEEKDGASLAPMTGCFD